MFCVSHLTVRFRFLRSCMLSLALVLVSLTLSAQEYSRLLTNEIAQLEALLDETSGLALFNGSLWTHNDSGDLPRLFQIDLTGTVQRVVAVRNAENVDWESMAQDADYLYVADTGNNANTRAELIIYRIAWSALDADAVDAELIRIRYGDYEAGNRLSHNFDAEGLAVKNDELWLFSKNRGNKRSTLYRFPKIPGGYTVQPSQSLPVNGLVTAADIQADTGRLALLLYRDNGSSFLWSAQTNEDGVDLHSTREIQLSPGDQWEALIFDTVIPHKLYLTHENNARDYAGLSWVLLE